ncbi:hypothetical protein SAMN05216436_107110 [bacterium A37T11]|nr:hypothetical protein SAMN05216436_107110 [bacterium A37T11]
MKQHFKKILVWLVFAGFLLTASCSKNTVKILEEDKDLPSENDVVGKVVVGYQGWFACPGDGSPANRWWHWGKAPNPGVEIWPDMREYTQTYHSGFANLGNGQPANLFSNYDNSTVQTHFNWMKENGIDCAALQRFGAEFGDYVFKNHRDSILSKVKTAAEHAGVKFYVMYDMSGWTDFQTALKDDWTNTVVGNLNVTSSAAYARQDGKPVVCIWGFGVGGNPGNASAYADVISWFKQHGCYVIIGVDRSWRTDASNYSAFITADMISPWTVGSYKYDVEIDDYYTNRVSKDLDSCNAHGVSFQPVIFPGFAWSNWRDSPQNDFPRKHGDFMWRQFAKIRENNIPNVYIAMFDEYNEGTAIAKAAEDASMIPTDHYFLTLDADGVHCSSDFYLRLTNDGGKMIKGVTPLVWAHPTSHL